MHGYFKQTLTVDVSNRSFQTAALSDAFLRACMGGKGLGTQLLLDRNPAGVDPFLPTTTWCWPLALPRTAPSMDRAVMGCLPNPR